MTHNGVTSKPQHMHTHTHRHTHTHTHTHTHNSVTLRHNVIVRGLDTCHSGDGKLNLTHVTAVMVCTHQDDVGRYVETRVEI